MKNKFIFFLKQNIYKFLIILLSVCLEITILVLEDKCILQFGFCVNSSFNIFDVTLALIPCVLTVLSITLTVGEKNEVLGLDRHDFNKLRSKFYIGFLGMILISISIFTSYLFLKIYGYYISIFALDLIAIAYCIFFCFEEIPILTKNENRLFRILSRAYKSPNKNRANEEKIRNLITKAGIYSILVYGIDKVYVHLANNKKIPNKNDVLDWLLTNFNDFLKRLSQKCEALIELKVKEFENIELSTIVDKSYEIVQSLISKNQECYIFEKNNNGRYYIERYLLLLHKITSVLKLKDIERDSISPLLSHITYDKNKSDELFGLFTEMTIFNIPTNDHWFIEYYLDISFPLQLFEKSANYFGVFIVIIFFYFTNYNQYLKEEYKNNLLDFLKHRTKVINSFGFNWLDNVARLLERKSNDIVEMLPFLNGLYDNVNKYYYSYVKNSYGSYIIDPSTTFEKEIVFDSWIQLFVHCNDSLNTFEELLRIINSLPREDKDLLSYRIGVFVQDRNEDFIRFIDQRSRFYFNEKNFEGLKKFHYMQCKKNTNKLYKPLDNKKNEELRSHVIKSFKKLINDNKFIKIENNSDPKSKFIIQYRIENENPKDLIDLYFKTNHGVLNNLISYKINQVVGKERADFDYEYTDEEFRKILLFSPSFQGRGRCLERYSYRKNIHFEFMPERIEELSIHTYLKNDAVKASFVIDESLTTVRPLTDEEKDRIILEEYKQVDDMFIYSDYGIRENEYFVTKDELKTILGNKYSVVEIHYSACFEIDKEKILVFI